MRSCGRHFREECRNKILEEETSSSLLPRGSPLAYDTAATGAREGGDDKSRGPNENKEILQLTSRRGRNLLYAATMTGRDVNVRRYVTAQIGATQVATRANNPLSRTRPHARPIKPLRDSSITGPFERNFQTTKGKKKGKNRPRWELPLIRELLYPSLSP